MRLIDADALLKQLLEAKDDEIIKAVIGLVQTQPTAYDISKVVEEVKKLSFEWLGDIRTCDVIKLVRKGGVE